MLINFAEIENQQCKLLTQVKKDCTEIQRD